MTLHENSPEGDAESVNREQTANERTLIYWTRSASVALSRELTRRAWNVALVSAGQNMRQIAGKFTCGILDLCGETDDAINGAASLCASMRGVIWVALVEIDQAASQTVRALIRDYCFDYITIPASPERVADAVGHAYGMKCLFTRDCEPIDAQAHGVIGSSDVMRHLFDVVLRLARTDAPIFISGETGSGKELTAIAIHRHSERLNGPFVAVNCGAIPPHLMQSELFGYERGAFTGASARKIGYIEAAAEGTLLLDEIGDLPYESQASLLRFLQEKKFHRLGGRHPIPVNIRIISATHVDLRSAVARGQFRADLFHRLCVMRIDQPPLRTRGSDIELLARYALDRFQSDANRRVHGFSADAIAALYKHDWPGNVRELLNRVRRSVVMTDGRLITARDLELEHCLASATQSVADIRKLHERDAVEAALLRSNGNVAAAAQEIGVSRASLYRIMRACGIKSIRGA
ncbi:sigma-54-dependent Fis family transcriptional regulator [Burkholderia sp. 9775_39]|nr:sigma-54-dependent Fis family transcriptional regulator [Burkholderia sp. 9775_39]MBG0888852.1 sigma-54-dependent Fis family transcriptional regulator [Burkholderia sp. 9773_38]